VKYFEDFVLGAVGQKSGSYLVTEAEIIEIAERWDPQPFHVDPVAAADTMFGGLVACSAHLFSISCSLSSKVPADEKVAAVSALGFDKLRLRAPVRPGDVVSMRSVVTELRRSKSRPGIGIVSSRGEMVNQHGEIVFSLESAAMIRCRQPGAEV
jgi:acyl dehydratase